MQFIAWLLSRMLRTILGNGHRRRTDAVAAEKEAGTFDGEYADRARNFEIEYDVAVRLLRDRLDKKFPSGHYGRLRAGENSPYDHGEDRAMAVDTMSTAIAMALRNGATVRAAAEAGAASVGI